MNDIPRLSIITPAYNAAPTVAETLRSVLGKTYPLWEQIVKEDLVANGVSRRRANQ